MTIFGAGAWGSALAIHVGARHDVLVHVRDPAQAQAVRQDRCNERALPGVRWPARVGITADRAEALAHALSGPEGLVIVATSVAGLRPTVHGLAATAQVVDGSLPLIWLCKGIESDTGLLPHEIVGARLGAQASVGALSGPSFAEEVARGLPVALTVASRSEAARRAAVAACHHGAMRIYAGEDVVGVELAGALKNVLAIAAGINDGLGLGLNARAALISRGLAEMARLGQARGARPDTFMGLCGVGDLVLTCTGDLSRNRRVGLALARGERLDAILDGLGHVAEGVLCARVARDMAARAGVELPIVEAVSAVLDGRLQPREAVLALLARQPTTEH